MTVSELISKLQCLDPNSQVQIQILSTWGSNRDYRPMLESVGLLKNGGVLLTPSTEED